MTIPTWRRGDAMRAAAALLAALGVAGCVPGYALPYAQAIDPASYRTLSADELESCVGRFTQLPREPAERFCRCWVNRMEQTHSVAEMRILNARLHAAADEQARHEVMLSRPRMQAAARVCAAEAQAPSAVRP